MRKNYNLEKRKYVIGGFIVLIAVIYLVRLFDLQINDGKYKQRADSNAFLKKTVYPSRGLIYDRNGELVVYNQPAYDVMLIPRDVQPFDTLDFCRTLNITPDALRKRFADMRDKRLNPGYSSYTPQRLISQLSSQDYGRLQEKLYRFPGFFIQKRILRQYNHATAANVLGNIREVNADDVKRDEYYTAGDYTGDLGVEKSYEPYLRGHKGVEILIRDARGRIQGRYEDGAHDVAPVSGRDIRLSLDIRLQEYAESLMVGKRGAVVAIEPSTGEILCLVSSPTYDPRLLVGRQRGENYRKLVNDETWPLFDRALMGAYPPGSTFKPTQGLILLQEGIINLQTTYPCYHGYINGGLRVGCHSHGSPLPLKPALQTSCNAFFCWGFKNMIDRRSKYGSSANAFEIWKKHLVSMGYGYKLGVDLPGESRGFLPNAKFYDKFYSEGHWSANTIISVSIGQGEILATPLQIANLCATIANRGWFITPHVVKQIQDTVMPDGMLDRRRPTIDEHWYADIAEGMRMAVTGGTCRRAALKDIAVAGKTGTAQNPHGKDHSAFMGFAPYEEPRIAVAAYVENAGFGATFGVPIGSLVMEKYLTGTIAPERKYMEQQMLNSTLYYAPARKK
ncbi:MAG: penicillin-binding protein 2 [Muribaculaceae bacterium]|nr:penicillin-binding protein 2 [Muribaculaceae bacterium]MDE6540728.1 penicillin-binding protein 2 [Muribaculaceae bacterium]